MEATFAQFIDFGVRVRFGSCTMSARFAKADTDDSAVRHKPIVQMIEVRR